MHLYLANIFGAPLIGQALSSAGWALYVVDGQDTLVLG